MKQTSQPLSATDVAIRRANFIARLDDAVFQALVTPLSVVVVNELLNDVAQRRLAEQD